MKQKTTWKTLAGLGVAAVAWTSLSKNLPKGVLIPEVPPGPPPKEYPYVCPFPYTNLTFLQLQGKLEGLEMDFKAKRISQDQYDSHFGVIQTCLGLLRT